MPLVLATFADAGFDSSEWLKLLALGGAVVALYMVARWVSGGGSDSAVHPPSEVPFPADSSSPSGEPPQPLVAADQNKPWELPPLDVNADEGPSPRNIQIRDWRFEHFDITSGPPDPDRFVDWLHCELYDLTSRQKWPMDLMVGTPAGLAESLGKGHLESMYLPAMLVVVRYDLRILRTAVLDWLGESESLRGDVPPEQSDSAAAG